MAKKIIIGSRGSDLALWQANFAKKELEEQGLQVEIKVIKTQGDRIQHLSFEKMEGKGFFTKELEEELLSGSIDLAVHSHKDLPTQSPPGLKIAGVSEREDPSELLLINLDAVDERQPLFLKKGAVAGTSSPRRKTQLRAFRPDIVLKDLRGNVPTRINKLRSGQYDAILIAFAGVSRLNLDLDGVKVLKLEPEHFIPAPAQGVLAYQIRENDEELQRFISKISDRNSAEKLQIERQVLKLFEGGCTIPLGCYCKKEGNEFLVWTSIAENSDMVPLRTLHSFTSAAGAAEKIVHHVKNIEPKKVFITRDLDEESYFKRILEAHDFEVTGESLINFEPVKFEEPPATDWIFFSSKKAVQYFFEQKPHLMPQVKIAALGEGTASKLRQYGLQIDFTGTGDAKTTSVQFTQLAAGKKVLFPIGENSLRSVQKQLSGNVTAVDLIVYSNQPCEEIAKSDADILVFTSPMNVSAYFSKYNLDKKQQVVAIGCTTGKALKEKGIEKFSTPSYYNYELNLTELVFSL